MYENATYTIAMYNEKQIMSNSFTDNVNKVRGSKSNFSPFANFWCSTYSSWRHSSSSNPSSTVMAFPPRYLLNGHSDIEWQLICTHKIMHKCNLIWRYMKVTNCIIKHMFLRLTALRGALSRSSTEFCKCYCSGDTNAWDCSWLINLEL